MTLFAKAPGKLVIFGEYAVLAGAPAIAGAVNRWVHVSLDQDGKNRGPATGPQPGGRTSSGFNITAIQSEAATCAAPSARVIRHVESIVAHILELQGSNTTYMNDVHLKIDSKECYDNATGAKLGLGSSAAVTVGLTAAVLRHIGATTLEPARLMEVSYRHHRLFQGNAGSGVDIAASTYGGIIGYRLNADSKHRPPSVQPLSLPPNLYMRFVWTGRSASTKQFIGSLYDYRQNHPRRYQSSMRDMTELAFEGSRTFEAGDTAGFLSAVHRYHRCLEELGNRIGRPIVSSDHIRIARMAHRSGVYYKPSGAGGGDFGILFSADPLKLDRIANNVSLAGYDLPDIRVGARGVRIYEK